ncbi:MAG: hypothetical protein ACOH12_06930 [Parvibaculaceae bacterium]
MFSSADFISVAKATFLGALLVLSAVPLAEASDNQLTFPIDPVLSMSGKDGARLDGSVSFYFGDTVHPKVVKSLGDAVTNKKTNSLGKSDSEACNWAMLSALLTLQDAAKAKGGNAVINITSYYKKEVRSYNKDFECHAGSFVTGVTLKGDIVTIKK